MKCALILFALVALASAQFQKSKFPAPRKPFASSFAPLPKVAQYAPPPVARASASVSDARAASTIKSGFNLHPDGSYDHFLETDNGIAAQEQGTPRDFGGNPPVVPVVVQGSFSYTSPEGQVVAVSYTADENGFQPIGDVIPTPPPVPEQIARSLDYILKHPQQK